MSPVLFWCLATLIGGCHGTYAARRAAADACMAVSRDLGEAEAAAEFAAVRGPPLIGGYPPPLAHIRADLADCADAADVAEALQLRYAAIVARDAFDEAEEASNALARALENLRVAESRDLQGAVPGESLQRDRVLRYAERSVLEHRLAEIAREELSASYEGYPASALPQWEFFQKGQAVYETRNAAELAAQLIAEHLSREELCSELGLMSPRPIGERASTGKGDASQSSGLEPRDLVPGAPGSFPTTALSPDARRAAKAVEEAAKVRRTALKLDFLKRELAEADARDVAAREARRAAVAEFVNAENQWLARAE